MTLEQKTVLLVDDDIGFSEMLSEILHEVGVRVVVEHDGVSGLAQARATQPDLLILDVMMPRMSGVELIKQIRSEAWGQQVHALMLTNMSEPSAEVQHDPNTEYLQKTDWTLDQLAEKVTSLLAA